MEIYKYLEESGLWHKSITKKKKKENVAKEQKGQFLCISAATLDASLLANTIGKAIVPGRGVIRADKGTIRAGQDL